MTQIRTTSSGFILCPKCGQNTFVKIRRDTVMKQFPLWCKNCKRETLIIYPNPKT